MPYASLGDFLVNAPLYMAEPFPGVTLRQPGSPGAFYLPVPKLIDRRCDKCGPTKWEIQSHDAAKERILTVFEYKCRNCDSAHFAVWIFWHRPTTVLKAGQYPKLEITIPKEFGAALGDKRSLYMRGMTLRHNAYGIGALTYFRRVIEDTTDEMLDLLEEAMTATGADPGALAALKQAKDGTRFEDKVRIAGEVMPANLRPKNVNPFADLYKLLSIGLHDRTDEECCEIVDAMDDSLKFIYTQLKTHMADANAYAASVQKVNAILAKVAKGPSARSITPP
jgi:hypothetical protein